jgi:hypothetical protein
MGGHEPQGRPYIEADFNRAFFLTHLAKTMESSLTQIILDDSTYKFTSWGKSHLQALASMLLPEGEFIFPPAFQVGVIGTHDFSTMEETLAYVKFRNYDLFRNSEGLLKSFIMPYITPSDEFCNSQEVKEAIAKYDVLKPFLSLPEKEFCDKQFELGFNAAYPPLVVGNEQMLTKEIARRIIESQVEERCTEDICLPHVKKVLEQFFTDVNIFKNVSLPFQSNYNKTTLPIVISAKPKR